MIKIKFAKFILLFTLAFVSLNACYPSDLECTDNQEIVVKAQKKLTQTRQDANEENSKSNADDKETHYCLCALSCHTVFFSFSKLEDFASYTLAYFENLHYTPHFYPEVSNELEKPPKV